MTSAARNLPTRFPFWPRRISVVVAIGGECSQASPALYRFGLTVVFRPIALAIRGDRGRALGPVTLRSKRRRADAGEVSVRVRKDDAAHDALYVEVVPLIDQRDAVKVQLAHVREQPEQTRSPFVQLAPDGLLRGDSSRGDPRVQRVSC